MRRSRRPSIATLFLPALLSLVSPVAQRAIAEPEAGLPEAIRDSLFPRSEGLVLDQGQFLGDPDLPILVLVVGTPPIPVLVVVDARNGQDTWQLNVDPIIAIATPEGQWVDSGVLAGRAASGSFTPLRSVGDVFQLLEQRLVRRVHL